MTRDQYTAVRNGIVAVLKRRRWHVEPDVLDDLTQRSAVALWRAGVSAEVWAGACHVRGHTVLVDHFRAVEARRESLAGDVDEVRPEIAAPAPDQVLAAVDYERAVAGIRAEIARIAATLPTRRGRRLGLAIARAKSLTAAARRVGVNPSQATRTMQRIAQIARAA